MNELLTYNDVKVGDYVKLSDHFKQSVLNSEYDIDDEPIVNATPKGKIITIEKPSAIEDSDFEDEDDQYVPIMVQWENGKKFRYWPDELDMVSKRRIHNFEDDPWDEENWGFHD